VRTDIKLLGANGLPLDDVLEPWKTYNTKIVGCTYMPNNDSEDPSPDVMQMILQVIEDCGVCKEPMDLRGCFPDPKHPGYWICRHPQAHRF
jgi:hypothetical protein